MCPALSQTVLAPWPVATDLSAVGIRVNTIAPGLIDTPIYGEGEGSEAFKAKLGESVLFPHRLGKRQGRGRRTPPPFGAWWPLTAVRCSCG